jgi:hypothetical protein
MAFSNRELGGLLLVLCALFLPAAILSQDYFVSGANILLLAIAFLALLYLFAKSKAAGLYEWVGLVGVLAGSAFLISMLAAGRSIGFEVAGFFLFAAYAVAGTLTLYYSASTVKAVNNIKGASSHAAEEFYSFESVNDFRARDQAGSLSQEFHIPEVKSQSSLTDYDDFMRAKKPGFSSESLDFFSDKNAGPKIQGLTLTTELIDLYPEAKLSGTLENKRVADSKAGEKLEVVELREAPMIATERIENSAQLAGKPGIDEKIRLIAEQALKEKSLSRKEVNPARANRPSLKVYSTAYGSRFHKTTSCMSLSRAKRKDLVTYKSSTEARKKKLKACGLCK